MLINKKIQTIFFHLSSTGATDPCWLKYLGSLLIKVKDKKLPEKESLDKWAPLQMAKKHCLSGYGSNDPTRPYLARSMPPPPPPLCSYSCPMATKPSQPQIMPIQYIAYLLHTGTNNRRFIDPHNQAPSETIIGNVGETGFVLSCYHTSKSMHKLACLLWEAIAFKLLYMEKQRERME